MSAHTCFAAFAYSLLVSYRPLAIIAAATSKNRLELIAVNARVASDASWHHRDGVVA